MKKTVALLILAIAPLLAELTMEKPLPTITLEGENGGYYNGSTWDSSMLQGKTTMLMYVDPDEKNKGEVFKPTIEAFEKDLDFDKFQILVILNLDATWKPDFVIRTLMKSKLADYPKRTYILDTGSVLVEKWGLANNEYNTVIINDERKVIYSHSGEWKDGEMSKIDTIVRSEVK